MAQGLVDEAKVGGFGCGGVGFGCGVGSLLVLPLQGARLVGQGHDVEVVGIVAMADEAADVLVHAALAGELSVEVVVAVPDGVAVEPFEERLAAVGEPHRLEQRVADLALCSLLLDDGGQLLVVAYHHQSAVGLAEQGEELRLQHLRCLVQDSRVWGLELQQFGCGGEAGHRAADDADGGEFVQYGLAVGAVGYGVVQQPVAIGRGARYLLPQAHVGAVDLGERGTDFVDGPVGVGHEEEVLPGVPDEEVFYHVAEGDAGLAASRWTHKEVVVGLRRGASLRKQKVAAARVAQEQSEEAAILDGEEAVAVRGLDGIAGGVEDVVLREGQAQAECVGQDALDDAAHALVVGQAVGIAEAFVEHHAVALAEVGAVGLALGLEVCDEAALVEDGGEAEVGDDVALEAFRLGVEEPCLSKATVGVGVARAHLGEALFASHEGRHRCEVVQGQGRCLVEGVEKLENARSLVVVVELVAEAEGIEVVLGERHEELHGPGAQLAVDVDDAVAQGHGLADDGGIEGDGVEARIVAVEEQGGHLLARHAQAVVEDFAIEVHLPGVFRLVGVVVLVALAALQFDDVGRGEEVETPLYAEQVADEGGLQLSALDAILGKLPEDGVLDVGVLALALREEAVVDALEGAVAQGVVAKGVLHAGAVVGLPVDGVVEKLVGHVTQLDGERLGARQELGEQIVHGRVAAGAHALADGGDVDEVVGVEHDEHGAEHAVGGGLDVEQLQDGFHVELLLQVGEG